MSPVLRWGLTLLLVLALFSVSILLVLSARWTYPFFRGALANPYGLSERQMQANYAQLIHYGLAFDPPPLNLDGLSMSKEGRIHFEEVRVIFQGILYTALLTVPVLALTLLWIWRRQKPLRFLAHGALFSWGSSLVLLFWMAWDFDAAFLRFHQLAFRNDYWQFSPQSDPIILYLPQRLFMWNAVAMLACFLCLSALAYFVGRKEKRPHSGPSA